MRKWSPVILITVSFDEILLSGKLDRYCWKIQCTHLEFPKIEFLKLNERRMYIIYGYIHHHLNWHFLDCDHFSKQRSPVWKFSSALPWFLSPVRKIILKHFSCVALMSWRWSIYSGKKIAFIGLGGVIGAARWYWGTGRLSLSMIINRTQSISPIIVAICLKLFLLFCQNSKEIQHKTKIQIEVYCLFNCVRHLAYICI